MNTYHYPNQHSLFKEALGLAKGVDGGHAFHGGGQVGQVGRACDAVHKLQLLHDGREHDGQHHEDGTQWQHHQQVPGKGIADHGQRKAHQEDVLHVQLEVGGKANID